MSCLGFGGGGKKAQRAKLPSNFRNSHPKFNHSQPDAVEIAKGVLTKESLCESLPEPEPEQQAPEWSTVSAFANVLLVGEDKRESHKGKGRKTTGDHQGTSSLVALAVRPSAFLLAPLPGSPKHTFFFLSFWGEGAAKKTKPKWQEQLLSNTEQPFPRFLFPAPVAKLLLWEEELSALQQYSLDTPFLSRSQTGAAFPLTLRAPRAAGWFITPITMLQFSLCS